MRITITKRGAEEQLLVERADGSRARFRIPRKGPVPHDAVHFHVEHALGLRRGFWGSVAAGEDPQAIQARAMAGGHASAKRAGPPSDDIVELLQAERLVECFEAEMWGGAADDAGIAAMAEAGWRASHVPPLALPPAALAAAREGLAAFGAEWQALPDGGSATLEWQERE